jgi:predicted lipoprotein with Yx(FWY)xxD motif
MASAGYFVAPNGMSLYTFDKDSVGTTVCTGDCLGNWPPLTVTSASAITVGTGLVASDFATITRPEGTSQVTFKQIPLYFFAGDSAPGDTNGDGVGGVWHLATTASTLPTAAPPTPTAGIPTPPAATPAATDTAPSPEADQVFVALSQDGSYLIDMTGMSLYTFDNDAPGVSNCNGDCAANWPALAATENSSVLPGLGVMGTLTKIERADGTFQVAYDDEPLYFYAGDNAAGDTEGDGIGGVWHLAQP